jgi:hypothetical protein
MTVCNSKAKALGCFLVVPVEIEFGKCRPTLHEFDMYKSKKDLS